MSPTALGPVVDHVRAHAGRYLGTDVDPAEVEVRVTSDGSRVRARLHRLELRAGERRLKLVVKETSLADAPEAAGEPDRPRLTVVADTHERHLYEYRGLLAAQEHFSTLGDPRFTFVRVFDHLPDQRAFVLEDVPHQTLRDLLAGPGRFTQRGRVAAAFENAGAWLREFHSLPPPDEEPPLRATRAEVERALREQAAFVEARGGGALAAEAAERAVAALGALPDPLPVGLWHQDFAPRNVFVTDDGAVAGFDMAARRRSPVYEDIAFFLMSLRSGKARRAIGLLPRAPRGRSANARRFLAGYFGAEPVPEAALAVFGLLVTLDDWARVALDGSAGSLALRALRGEVAALASKLPQA